MYFTVSNDSLIKHFIKNLFHSHLLQQAENNADNEGKVHCWISNLSLQLTFSYIDHFTAIYFARTIKKSNKLYVELFKNNFTAFQKLN